MPKNRLSLKFLNLIQPFLKQALVTWADYYIVCAYQKPVESLGL
jgi:hypothetical protein